MVLEEMANEGKCYQNTTYEILKDLTKILLKGLLEK